MTLVEQFGLSRMPNTGHCGCLGLCVDDWDAVEPCMFCSGGDTDESFPPDPNYLARFRRTPTEEEIEQDVDALRRALDEMDGTDED